MKKIEFLNILNESLRDEIPPDKVDENVRYYDEYISSKGDEYEQENEIESIGEPRLIAQTIIESYKMSDEYKYTGQADNKTHTSYNSDGYSRTEDSKQMEQQATGSLFWTKIKRTVIIAIVVIIVLFVLSLVARVFIYVGIPIIMCCLLIKLLTSIFKK